MSLPPMLQTIVEFVRKGYPQGVPQQDYIPLFALLRRRLSAEEADQVVADLVAGPDAADPEVIAEAIQRLIHEPPSENDVERVRQRLAAVGWEPDAAL